MQPYAFGKWAVSMAHKGMVREFRRTVLRGKRHDLDDRYGTRERDAQQPRVVVPGLG